MKKVILSANTAWNIYNFRAGLIGALIENDFEVIVAAPHDESAQTIAEMGCRVVTLSMDNKGTSLTRDFDLFRRYVALFRREKPDIFLGYTIKPNIYGSLAAHILGIPVINNVSGLGTAFIRDNWLTRVVKNLYRVSLSRSHTVFFQNEDDRTLFTSQRLVRYKRTVVLPGSGIDLERFRPPPEAGAFPRTGEPTFLLVARMLWDKGVGEFVEAARILKQAGCKARFQLLGFLDVENRTAVPRPTVEKWVAEGLVEYLGAQSDVRPFIAAAHCIVLPSYREGTPRTLLEGAAMGKPLIATDVPGCREVVDDHINGFLCTVRDCSDLAAKMRAFLELPDEVRNRMGRMGRQKMEREFDERFVVSRYLQTIERAISTNGYK